VLVEVACTTDFAAKTEVFRDICRELAMQIAAMAPADVTDLLDQQSVRDPDEFVDDRVASASAALGELVMVRRFVRWEIEND